MRYLERISKFMTNEDGAVTADWVVLTASIVLLAGFVFLAIEGSITSTTNGIAEMVESAALT